MRRAMILLVGMAALAAAPTVDADEKSFTAGDGTAFSLPIIDGLPGRAESEDAVFEAAGFETQTTGEPHLTDRFSFVFKGGRQPQRVRVEDVTLATPILIAEAAVPEDLPGAGFRRERFEMSGVPCAIARGEPCSEWMFGEQLYRIYRATLVYEDGESQILLQAEPFRMSAFIARLGDRVPTRSTPTPDRTAQEPL